jgi:BirA family transcriptional regulator, biotin operon repressor / biotin---[acetyl-CoA-carboxylase] ligase
MSSSYGLVFEDLLLQGWLKSCQHFAEIDSTNSVARRMGSEQPELQFPSLLVADRQTQGRGRGGHVWWSPDGCLMLTLVVTSEQLPADRSLWSQLALLTGVSAAAAVDTVCPELNVQLKWPNDLYLKGKKLGGILIESFSGEKVLSSERTQFAIGIGINVAMDWQSAPSEVQSRATCLSQATARTIKREEVLHELVVQLASHINRWKMKPACWFEDWHQRCFLSGRVISVNTLRDSGKQILSGLCEGVAQDGQLLLRTENGVLHSFNAGEVVSWS